MHWEALVILCKEHDLDPYIITTDYIDLPPAHRQLGWIDPVREAMETGFAPKIYYLSKQSYLQRALQVFRYLREIKPDVVWAQEEPNMPFLYVLLIYYYFSPARPKIIAAVCENIFPFTGLKRFLLNILWRRLDGLLAVATASITGVRKGGMPERVRAVPLVAGCLSPKTIPIPRPLTLRTHPDDVVFGFAGRLISYKGWRVIIEALRQLPQNYKLIMAADGPDREAFASLITAYGLQTRVQNLGFLPKDELWSLYKAMDCLIVPSQTVSGWTEQFGGVLADAMVSGIPIIGSDSGAIPEVVGPAGIIVPENNPVALMEAMRELADNKQKRLQLGAIGEKRFAEEFSIPAYAKKIARELLT
jgi:glycosyltransferase involved in cell wall biosynthesis